MDQQNDKQNEVKQDKEQSQDKEQTELERCKKQCQEYLDGWKRAKADLINYKKDEEKRFKEFAEFVQMEIIRDILNVLDSFYAAVDLPEGVQHIQKQLEDVLKRHGVEEIPVHKAQLLDPNFHEAIGEEESDQEPGTITKEVVKGYTLNGRVIRPAKVKVAKSGND